MRKWTLDHARLWVVLMVAALLSVVPLAWFQYRWIGQISEAERERRQAHLYASVTRFARELDGEVAPVFRLLLYGRLGGWFSNPPDLAGSYARYLEAGGEPRLIKNLYWSQGGVDGLRELLRLDPAAGQVAPVAWPAELQPLRAQLQAQRVAGPQFGPPQPPFENRILALFAPRWQPPSGRMPPERWRGPRPELAGWSIIELDVDFFSQQLLPALVRRHFLETGEADYRVTVVSQRDPGRTIYTSDAALPPSFFASPDASASLLNFRFERGLRFLAGPPGQPSPEARPPGPFWQPPGAPPQEPPEPIGAWRLLVRHSAGSLEAAVAQTRRRNLGISFATLLLITGSLAVLLVWTRRAQRLARMQMEFVAGVSHELRTPLSVICSAGDNLADGLVSAPQQVRRYGSVIRGEGRRLGQMVESILGFAGIQSGRMRYELQPVAVADVVSAAVAASEPDIRAAGCTLETQFEPDLPQISADATALSHALRNLIDNAVTHGGDGKWVGVRARSVPASDGRQVEIVVEDRGRGIDARELSRLFEPFFRGRRAVEEQVRGFGLGLTLAQRIIQAHAGTLTAESASGQGTRFIVRLPASGPAPLSEGDGERTNSADRG